MDYLAGESQFLDHLLPIWRAEPGSFYIHGSLREHARRRGVPAQAIHVPPSVTPSSSDEQPILTASYGDIKKARRLGRTSIAFIEHGIGQSYAGVRGRAESHGSYAGGTDRADVGMFLVPNEHSAGRWRNAYPRSRVEVVGSPRLDELPAREPGLGPVVALSFHWNCHLAPETMTALGHFLDALPGVAKRWTTIGHAHPRGWVGTMRYYRRMGITPVEDFLDVCRQADVYVCDNSSSMYEFAATGRPVVVLNAPGYRRNVDHGLRFWEAATVGVQVNRKEELTTAIERALEERPEDVTARERALDIVYRYRTGGTERAVAALRSWASHAVPPRIAA